MFHYLLYPVVPFNIQTKSCCELRSKDINTHKIKKVDNLAKEDKPVSSAHHHNYWIDEQTPESTVTHSCGSIVEIVIEYEPDRYIPIAAMVFIDSGHSITSQKSIGVCESIVEIVIK